MFAYVKVPDLKDAVLLEHYALSLLVEKVTDWSLFCCLLSHWDYLTFIYRATTIYMYIYGWHICGLIIFEFRQGFIKSHLNNKCHMHLVVLGLLFWFVATTVTFKIEMSMPWNHELCRRKYLWAQKSVFAYNLWGDCARVFCSHIYGNVWNICWTEGNC